MIQKSKMEAQSALLLFLALSVFVWSHAAEDNTRDLSVEDDRELERELKTLNKPFVKSFQDKYGITYDCVDIYKQPAFDHPLLKNHTLQFPKRNLNINKTSTQQKFPKRCPTGTVLIRRTTKKDLVRAKKYAQHIQSRMQPIQLPILNAISRSHYATVEIHAGEGPKFYGIGASFYAYQLYISLFQGTASRIILTKGERGPKKYLNAVEAGWHIDDQLEADDYPHFFIYWTSDGFQKTGCQNMICKGFVQTSTRVTPGMVLDNLVELALSIYRDKFTSNWMLYNDNEHVGYWPKEIFNNMEDCSQVQMGGNAYSQINLPSPPMGNGVLNQAKFEKVFMIDGDGSKSKVPVDKVTTYTDLGEDYYGVSPDFENDMLYYGGPGGWTGI